MLISIMEIISFKNFYIRKSIQIYDEMMREKDYNKDYHVYKVIYLYINRHVVYMLFAITMKLKENV